MTIGEATVTAGNNRKGIIGKRRTINEACRKAVDIHTFKLDENDYTIVVNLESLEGHPDTVFLDDFLAAPNC